MSYLLDTNVCIAYLNDPQSPPALKMRSIHPGEIMLCAIVQMELYFGAFRSSRRQSNLALLAQFLPTFTCLPFDEAAAIRCGELRAHLAAVGTPIGPYDLQIAAIALTHDCILVTNNTREFSRVPALKLENWHVSP